MSESSIGIAVTKSLVLHGAIVLTVVAGALFKTDSPHVIELGANEPQEREIIEAVAVDEARVLEQVAQIQNQREEARRAEEARVAELERRAREAEQRRQREQQEARRAEQQRREQESLARAEAERLEQARREAEQRLEAQRLEEERLAEERRQREEQERREEEAARAQAEFERQLREAAEQERAEREQARQRRVLSEVERYQVLIRQTIQRNWLTDPSMRGKSCELRISIARDGFVTNVQIMEGDRAVCESAQAAVLRAGSLPVSEDPDVYREMNNILLRVEPNL
ncbi:cell envelope integrity protein TolA [Aliidiomarina celeris]|uniref:cell envelope integrity protein TolA n=1 Tax=Aliidiomarina celeris TaxID=2249428 RepID=UPI000DE907EE|nr:cell envelope integrity protein TolA [Aliidiomarina celeris]